MYGLVRGRQLLALCVCTTNLHVFLIFFLFSPKYASIIITTQIGTIMQRNDGVKFIKSSPRYYSNWQNKAKKVTGKINWKFPFVITQIDTPTQRNCTRKIVLKFPPFPKGIYCNRVDCRFWFDSTKKKKCNCERIRKLNQKFDQKFQTAFFFLTSRILKQVFT